MDYKTLMKTLQTMNDEELFLAEKKISEERTRRAIQQVTAQASLNGGPVNVLIDFVHLANAVRDKMRAELSMSSESALASVLDQIRDYPKEAGDEDVVMRLLGASMTAVLIHEARCEAARRLDSIK